MDEPVDLPFPFYNMYYRTEIEAGTGHEMNEGSKLLILELQNPYFHSSPRHLTPFKGNRMTMNFTFTHTHREGNKKKYTHKKYTPSQSFFLERERDSLQFFMYYYLDEKTPARCVWVYFYFFRIVFPLPLPTFHLPKKNERGETRRKTTRCEGTRRHGKWKTF